MPRKYELTDETVAHLGRTLYRIRAVRSFGDVQAGDEGGFIEGKYNLDQGGNARASDNAWVTGNARLSGTAWVSGNAGVSGNAVVTSSIIAATRSDGYTFVCTPTKDGPPVIIAGCRYFTFEQAREHWTRTRGGTRLGDESLALVDHLERMARIAGWTDADAATQAA